MRWSPVLLAALGACTWVSNADHQARLAALDVDGDGYLDAARGGTDCDDDDPAVNPGAPERCDTPGDDDCDGLADADDPDAVGLITGFADADFDGFGAHDAEPETACPGTSGLSDNNDDCNDDDPNAYPGAPEECPGYGPDLDCSDEPRPCELVLDERTDVLIDGHAGLGEGLSGHGDLLAAVVEGDVWVWDLAGHVDTLAAAPKNKDGVTVGWFLSAEDHVEATVGPGGVVIGAPAADDYGLVATVARDDKDALVVDDYVGGGRKQIVGKPVGWIPAWRGEDGGWPVSVHGGGGRIDMLIATDGGWESGPKLGSGVSRVAGASNPYDGSTTVGARYESGSAGSLQLYTWPEFSSSSWANGSIRGDSGSNLGHEFAFADLSGDGQSDVIAATAHGVAGWDGSLVRGEQRLVDAAWSHETGVAPASLAVGDFDGDGGLDFAVGLPELSNDSGEVWVYMSEGVLPAGTGDAPRMKLKGVDFGQRLGAALAFARVNDDEIDDLVVGVPGDASFVLVPGSDAW